MSRTSLPLVGTFKLVGLAERVGSRSAVGGVEGTDKDGFDDNCGEFSTGAYDVVAGLAFPSTTTVLAAEKSSEGTTGIAADVFESA